MNLAMRKFESLETVLDTGLDIFDNVLAIDAANRYGWHNSKHTEVGAMYEIVMTVHIYGVDSWVANRSFPTVADAEAYIMDTFDFGIVTDDAWEGTTFTISARYLDVASEQYPVTSEIL